jgi:oligopeptide/dipeptide ABC transporter ATP-binding protein
MGSTAELDLSDTAMQASAGGRKPILKVSHLSVFFSKGSSLFARGQGVRAVNDVSFELFPSEVFCLVGESGSGKTTLGRCLTGLTPPTSGSIHYGDRELHKFRGKELHDYRRDVQMIFQDPFDSLDPRQTVFETVSTPLRLLSGEKDQAKISETVLRLVSEVGLDPNMVLQRLPHQLSGGERQRVNIARALAPSPKVLVADEPVTMVDASQRLEILSLLLDLKSERNLSVILVTHDLASARAMADRIAVMYLGRLVELGSARDVFSNPHHPYTELILSATPTLDSGVQLTDLTAADQIGKIEMVSKGCVFRPRCKYATSICSESEPKFETKSSYHLAACHNALSSAGRMEDSRRSQL